MHLLEADGTQQDAAERSRARTGSRELSNGLTLGTIGIPFEVDSGQEVSNEIDITTLYFTLTGRRRISRI